MTQPMGETYSFYLARKSYWHTSLLGWLLICASCSGAIILVLLGLSCWPTYTHTFTPYLKWQDALLATLWFGALVLLWSCLLVLRFLLALRAGYRQGVFVLHGHTALTVRDLSPKNFASIYWATGTAFSCFLAALLGLVPVILIGWTLHLPHPVLAFLATAAALILSLAGLAVTLVASSFIVIGLIGSLSFGRRLGAPHTYLLSSHTTIRIDNLVLTVIYPDRPETMFDLNLLAPRDQRHLLMLLQKRWLAARRPWNPRLDEEIAAALEEAQHFTTYINGYSIYP